MELTRSRTISMALELGIEDVSAAARLLTRMSNGNTMSVRAFYKDESYTINAIEQIADIPNGLRNPVTRIVIAGGSSYLELFGMDTASSYSLQGDPELVRMVRTELDELLDACQNSAQNILKWIVVQRTATIVAQFALIAILDLLFLVSSRIRHFVGADAFLAGSMVVALLGFLSASAERVFLHRVEFVWGRNKDVVERRKARWGRLVTGSLVAVLLSVLASILFEGLKRYIAS